MNVLSRPQKSFKVSNLGPKLMGCSFLTQNFKIDDEIEMLTSIDHGSILIKILGELSSENNVIIGQIKSMLQLGDNWDSEGALKIPLNVVERAIAIVRLINQSDYNVYLAAPGPNQEILLIVKIVDREIELVIYPNREKYIKFEGTEFIEQGDLYDKEIDSLLEWLAKNE